MLGLLLHFKIVIDKFCVWCRYELVSLAKLKISKTFVHFFNKSNSSLCHICSDEKHTPNNVQQLYSLRVRNSLKFCVVRAVR